MSSHLAESPLRYVRAGMLGFPLDARLGPSPAGEAGFEDALSERVAT